MALRDLLARIAKTYDQALGFDSEAQQLLRTSQEVLAPLVPTGYRPHYGRGRGVPASVPWIGVFDPDETESAQRGMYVVYLFAADMRSISLCLAQGVTELTQQYGAQTAREKLRAQAEAVRGALGEAACAGLETAIDLHSRGTLPRSYEASVILARTYSAAALPPDDALAADLTSFLRLYQNGLALRESLRAQPGSPIATPPTGTTKPQPTLEFKPKDDSDYKQTIAARRMVKSRKHETLVRSYGRYLADHGFRVGVNVHPRDMVAERAEHHWLIEAKVVYRGDGVSATRDALSQLLMYRDFLYPSDQEVGLVAVFNEQVGDLCSGFLTRHRIVPVWFDASGWIGSADAVAKGLSNSR